MKKTDRTNQKADLPVPTHLQPYLQPTGEHNNEYEVTGVIQCPCGSGTFEVWESNERQIVTLGCRQCGKEILVFVSGRHGWDGFVCKADFLDRALPGKKYHCPKCGQDVFRAELWISSQGKQDFLEECVANDPSFSPDDWVNGFDWIRIGISCVNCSFKDKDWVDMETM